MEPPPTTRPKPTGKRIPDGQPMSLRTQYRRRAAAGLTQPVFRYPWNQRVFDSWSDDVAWLLGLIWSDGYLQANRVDICSKDRDLLESAAEVIGMENGVRPKNGGRHWYLCFSSPHAAKRLRALGLTQNKSFTVPWPTDLPDEHSGAFARGLLDGDGTVCLHHHREGQAVGDLEITLNTASEALADGYANFLRTRGVKHSIRQARTQNLIRVRVGEQAALTALYSALYSTPSVRCLRRKRAIVDRWLDTPRVTAHGQMGPPPRARLG